MLDLLRHGLLAYAIVVTIAAGAVYAQEPQPPPPPADPAQGDPQPAGVGSAAAPKVDEEQAVEGQQSTAAAASTAGASGSRPFSGLFGGAAPANPRKDSLDFTGSIFGVHLIGDTINSNTTSQSDLVLSNGTINYAGAGTSLRYNHAWSHASFGADGNASIAYLPDSAPEGGDPWVDRWLVGADVDFDHNFTPKLRASGGVQTSYSPYYQQDLLLPGGIPTTSPGSIVTPGLDFAILREPSVGSNVIGNLTYAVSPRSSFEAVYHLFRRDFISPDVPSYSDQLIRGLYRFRMNRYFGVHAGYGYRSSRYTADGTSIKSHEIDAGADGGYGKSYSLSRRTTFSFNTGSSIFVDQQVNQGDPNATFNPRTRFFVTGSANLVHGWARTWSANVGVARSIDYEFGFAQPFLSNQAYAGAGGLLNQRVDVRAQASYTGGTVGFGNAGNGFSTASAQATVRWALARQLAAYAQYFYYRSTFDAGVTLPIFLPRDLNRWGATVGLTVWVPLLGSRGYR